MARSSSDLPSKLRVEKTAELPLRLGEHGLLVVIEQRHEVCGGVCVGSRRSNLAGLISQQIALLSLVVELFLQIADGGLQPQIIQHAHGLVADFVGVDRVAGGD